jgi:uncharacterized membrane protein YvbJ
MTCRKCGTEIADRAIVCYKCGTATTDPVFQPPAAGRRAGSNIMLTTSLAALALLVVAAMFLSRTPADGTRPITWVVAGVAVVIIILRAYARRR